MGKKRKHHRMHMDVGYPWRREKRFFNRLCDTGPNKGEALYLAYVGGQYCQQFRPNRPNPYPPGKRHDEWQRGRTTEWGR